MVVHTCKAAQLYLCTHKGSRYRSHPQALTLAAGYFSLLTHFFCVWIKELLVTPGVRCHWFLATAASWCWMLFCYLSATWFAAHSAALQTEPIVCLPAWFLQPAACAAQVRFAGSFHANRRFVHAGALGVLFEANLSWFVSCCTAVLAYANWMKLNQKLCSRCMPNVLVPLMGVHLQHWSRHPSSLLRTEYEVFSMSSIFANVLIAREMLSLSLLLYITCTSNFTSAFTSNGSRGKEMQRGIGPSFFFVEETFNIFIFLKMFFFHSMRILFWGDVVVK